MNKYLFVSDFDGTIAQTFESTPDGMDVHKAYERAIHDVLGDAGLYYYRNSGGLKNRSPGELVRDLLTGPTVNFLLDNARSFTKRLVREGETVSWSMSNTTKTITDLLTRQKLGYLMSQIGRDMGDGETWPRPCEGYEAFHAEIKDLKEEGLAEFAIVSTGHTEFLKRTYRSWGLQTPSIMITEDDMARRRYPQEPERRTKPSTYPFAMAHQKWLNGDRENGQSYVSAAKDSRARIMYFGDDTNKDGRMAKSSNVLFGHFDVTGMAKDNGSGFAFSDWREVAKILADKRSQLVEGRPLTELFTQNGRRAECINPGNPERR
jgi:2-hydroxy-3-keto-5-methylthiopentenyl-1-phosphate phosphatase